MNEKSVVSGHKEPDANDFISMPAARVAELKRLEIEALVKDSLLAWGKSRFWWVTLALTVVGALGGSALITTTITSLVDKKVETYIDPLRITALEATAAARAADSSIARSTQNIEELEVRLRHRIDECNKQLELTKEVAANLERREFSRDEDARSVSRDLGARINRLEALIAGVGTSGALLEPISPEDHKENAKYGVTIFANSRNRSLASSVVEVLVREGFRASQQDIESKIEQLKSIINSPIQADVSQLRAELEAIPKRNVLRKSIDALDSVVQRISEQLKKLNITFKEDAGSGMMAMKSGDISIYLME
jgi:hypothetical protein